VGVRATIDGAVAGKTNWTCAPDGAVRIVGTLWTASAAKDASAWSEGWPKRVEQFDAFQPVVRWLDRTTHSPMLWQQTGNRRKLP
jgi:hypothetical protein